MSFYLDASVIVALLVPESHSDRANQWLSGHLTARLAISDWVTTEVISALSARIRFATLSDLQRAHAAAHFNTLSSESFKRLSIGPDSFRVATQYCSDVASGIRAADALHLAIAGQHGFEVATLDRVMAEAGPKLGVRTVLI